MNNCGDIKIICSSYKLMIFSFTKAFLLNLLVLPVKAFFGTTLCVGNSKLSTPLSLNSLYTSSEGTAVAQWLRCCATNRKVACSIQAGVSGFFIDIKLFRSHCGHGVDSAPNRNEYQEHFLGEKRSVHKAFNLTLILCRFRENWEP